MDTCCILAKILTDHLHFIERVSGGSVVKRRTPEREVGGFETYLRRVVVSLSKYPESTDNTQEAQAPSRHD